jgi:hypothetical protein
VTFDINALQRFTNLGYGIAAQYLGATYNQFRPVDPLNPLANQIGIVQAAFDIDAKFSGARPAKPGLALYYAMADFSVVQQGDYLMRAETAGCTDLYFFAGSEPAKPPQCVRCNRLLTLIRPGMQAGAGEVGYGGDNAGHDTALLGGWPANVDQGTKGNNGPVNLPEDTRMGWIKAMLPVLPAGIVIQSSDVLTDDLDRRFVVSSAELSWTGWRVTAELTEA